MIVQTLLQDSQFRSALDLLNSRMDVLCPNEKVNTMPEIPESGFVGPQSKKIHGEYAMIVEALPNKEFSGKNGPYYKAQVRVEFVKDKAKKIWTFDNNSLKKFANEYGTNSDSYVGKGVKFRDMLLPNGSESIVGEPVSPEVIRATLGGP